jgi:hypothetical protein
MPLEVAVYNHSGDSLCGYHYDAVVDESQVPPDPSAASEEGASSDHEVKEPVPSSDNSSLGNQADGQKRGSLSRASSFSSFSSHEPYGP